MSRKNFGIREGLLGEEREIVRHFEDCVPTAVLKKGQVAHKAGTGSLWHILRLDHTDYAAMRKQRQVYTSMGRGAAGHTGGCAHTG